MSTNPGMSHYFAKLGFENAFSINFTSLFAKIMHFKYILGSFYSYRQWLFSIRFV